MNLRLLHVVIMQHTKLCICEIKWLHTLLASIQLCAVECCYNSTMEYGLKVSEIAYYNA